jgi:hypothetical protein
MTKVAVVDEAVRRTCESATAAIAYSTHLDTPSGLLLPGTESATGHVDFLARRVVASVVFPGGTAIERFEGAARYVRTEEGEFQINRDLPGGPLYFSHPLWLLDALAGTVDVSGGVQSELQGDIARHYLVEVNPRLAHSRTLGGLQFPVRPTAVDVFPAELWLDGEGRIRRMSCAWPAKRTWLFGPYSRLLDPRARRQPPWETTDFWDFGCAEAPSAHSSR